MKKQILAFIIVIFVMLQIQQLFFLQYCNNNDSNGHRSMSASIRDCRKCYKTWKGKAALTENIGVDPKNFTAGDTVMMDEGSLNYYVIHYVI